MKKTLKVLAVTLAVVLLAACVLPFLFKDRVKEFVRQQAAAYVDADVQFGGLRISLLRDFPNARISLNDVVITGHAPFEGDTLTAFETLSVTADLKSVIRPEHLTVKRILLAEPLVSLRVAPDGRANWDIWTGSDEAEPAAADESGAPSRFGLDIEELRITNASIRYTDDTTRFLMQPAGVLLSGRLTTSQTLLHLAADFGRISLWYDGNRLLNGVETRWDADIAADLDSMCFTLKDNAFYLNDLLIRLSGRAGMQDDTLWTDLAFEAPGADLKSLLSMVPAVYMQDYASLKTTGTLQAAGTIRGRLDDERLPDIGLQLQVKDGTVQYAALPESIRNIAVDLDAFMDGACTDSSVVTLRELGFTMAGNPFHASGSVRTPGSDLLLQAVLKGIIDFNSLPRYIPMETETLQGRFTADAALRLHLNDVLEERYEKIDCSGSLRLDKFTGRFDSLPVLRADAAELRFSPQTVALTSSGLQAGRTRLHSMNGELSDFIPFLLSDAVLKGGLDLKAACVDLNEWMEDTDDAAAQEADTVQLELPDIPRNLDLHISLSADTLLYDRLTLRESSGDVRVKDGILTLQPLTTRTLGGQFTVNGSYVTRDTLAPSFQFDVKAASVQTPALIMAFETLQKLVPNPNLFSGNLTAQFAVASDLNRDLTPILPTMRAEGFFQSEDLAVSKSPVLNGITRMLHRSDTLDAIHLRNTKISFTESDGRVNLSTFDIPLAKDIALQLGGSIGLDRTLDYQIKVALPVALAGSLLGDKVSDQIQQGIPVTLFGKEVNARIDPESLLHFAGNIRGTTDHPKVSLDLNQFSLADGARTAVRTAASEKVSELTAQASEKIRNEAQKAAEKTRAEAEEAASKLEKAAEGKNLLQQAAAKVAADKVRKEGEKAAQKILDEAEKRIASPDQPEE